MADDPNPALRTELKAALDILAPQNRGLEDLLNVSISPELRAELVQEQNERRRRSDLILSVLHALDATFQAIKALEADGYPIMAPSTLSPELFAELQGQEFDIDAAVDLFSLEEQPASTVSVNLGAPTDKPPAAT